MSRFPPVATFTVDSRLGRRGITVIEAAGELDFYTGPMLRNIFLTSLAEGNALIVIDLGGLEFLDSTGLAVLIRGLKECNAAGGALALACLTRRTTHTLRTAGVLHLFDLYDAVEAAEDFLSYPSRAMPR